MVKVASYIYLGSQLFLTSLFCFQDIGAIEYIHVWHDNSGKSPAWFLARVSIHNILTDEQTEFLCHKWFALDQEDGELHRCLLAANNEELKSFETLFLTQSSRDFCDSHLWFSIAMRPARSVFTRLQRVSCCLCILLSSMLANAMFYKSDEEFKAGTEISLGPFQFSWKQIIIGVESSLIVLPLNFLMIEIFRRANSKSRDKRTSRESKTSSTATLQEIGILINESEDNEVKRDAVVDIILNESCAGKYQNNSNEKAPKDDNSKNNALTETLRSTTSRNAAMTGK